MLRFRESIRGRFFGIVVWALFGATCLQLAFQQPYLVIIPGQRANLFSALLCVLTLIGACIYQGKRLVWLKRPDTWISLILCFLLLLNACFSLDRTTSGIRGFVLASSGLGGYWCAKLLLDGKSNRWFFQWFCVLILSLIVLISLINYRVFGDISQYTPWNISRHVVTDLILLLSFAPLTLVFRGSQKQIIFGFVLLCCSFLVLCISGERSAVLIPIGLTFLMLLLRGIRLRYAALIMAIMVICTIGVYHRIPQYQMKKDSVRVYYRIEAYPFSWHIAKKHPFLGKGLLAPREKFLEDYKIRYPHISREQFSWAIGWARSPENMILMLMSELGFPFLLIYGASFLYLAVRLLTEVRKRECKDIFPPLALFLPIVGGMVHYMVFDGFLFPQLCWYFHLLLGFIREDP